MAASAAQLAGVDIGGMVVTRSKGWEKGRPG